MTTFADVINATDGVLSLREAVLAANASAGVADTINLPAGTYTLTLTGAGEAVREMTGLPTVPMGGTSNTAAPDAGSALVPRIEMPTARGLRPQRAQVTGYAKRSAQMRLSSIEVSSSSGPAVSARYEIL